MDLSWSDIGEIIKAVAPVFTASAACFGAYIGYHGLTKWHTETVGKRRVELAESVLADIYEAKEIIEHARSPGGFSHEGATRPRSSWETEQDSMRLDAYFRTHERLAEKNEFFARLGATRYRVMAVLGKEAAAPYEDLYRIRGQLITSVMMLIQTYEQRDQGSLPQDRQEWEKAIGWRTLEGDKIAERLDTVITSLERICRPIIEAAMK